MSKNPVSYENLDYFETFWNDIGNIVNADPEDLQSDILAYVKYIRLYKQQAEERGKALKEIADFNNPTGEDGREMIEIARSALGKEQPNE